MKATEIINELRSEGICDKDIHAALCDGAFLATRGWNESDVEDAFNLLDDLIKARDRATALRASLEDPASFNKDLRHAVDNCEGDEFEAGCIHEVCDKYSK